jgi:outer membrane protein assembly factor BamA
MKALRAALLLLLALALCSGCAANRERVQRNRKLKEPDLRPVVTRVKLELEGQGRGKDRIKRQLPKSLIVPKLGQRGTHPLHWVPVLNFVFPRVHLDGTAWQDDPTRIANIYAINGFFDARASASQVIPKKLRKDGTTPYLVWVQHTVDEGEPSSVRQVVVRLAPDGSSRRSISEEEELRQALSFDLPIQADERFSMARARLGRATILGRLADQAYARARVELRVDAYPEENLVDVGYDVRPGAPGVFGEVTIHGLDKVRDRYIERQIRFKSGEVWRARKVRRTQQALYNMGVFALVTVSPDLRSEVELLPDGTEVVPVDIFLKERKPRSFEGGGGVGFTMGSFDVHGRIAFSDVNVGGRLVRFDTSLEGGLVYLGPEDIGPGVEFDIGLTWPQWPHRTLSLYVGGAYEMDVRKGYKYLSGEGEVGVTWNPWRPLRLALSYSASAFKLYDNRLDDLELLSRRSEIAFDDGYFLTVLGQEIVLDLRDNLLAPNKGAMVSLTVDEALPPGGFRYIKVIGDARGYIPLGTPRLVFAMRGVGSYIHTWGDQHQVPIQEALFAGGDGSVRGWKPRYLGPRTVEEDCDRRDCIVPLGGKIGFTGSGELRGKVYDAGAFGLWVAGFTDFGRVWNGPDDIEDAADFFEELQFSVGGGARLDLSIGRIRLDFAIHPNPWTDDVFRQALIKPPNCETLDTCPLEMRKEPANWSIHFGIGESF